MQNSGQGPKALKKKINFRYHPYYLSAFHLQLNEAHLSQHIFLNEDHETLPPTFPVPSVPFSYLKMQVLFLSQAPWNIWWNKFGRLETGLWTGTGYHASWNLKGHLPINETCINCLDDFCTDKQHTGVTTNCWSQDSVWWRRKYWVALSNTELWASDGLLTLKAVLAWAAIDTFMSCHTFMSSQETTGEVEQPWLCH